MFFIIKCVLSVNSIIRKLGLCFRYIREDTRIKKNSLIINIVDLIVFYNLVL